MKEILSRYVFTLFSLEPSNENAAGNGIVSRYPIHSFSHQLSAFICQGEVTLDIYFNGLL